jgi:hypothetical protein
MPKPHDMAVERSADRRRELWIALGLVCIAIAAATIEYGRDMGVTVLAVILGFAVHVRLFLGLGVLLGRLRRRRGTFPGGELAISGGLFASALLLHWLSPVPLGRVAALSALIAVVVSFAQKVLSRKSG